MTASVPPTALLREWRAGNQSALAQLTELVYDELKRLARRRLEGERHGHTLQPTALVHEAFLRLVGMDVEWQDKTHFMVVAARTMRRILVDHARARGRDKRGGYQDAITLDASEVGGLTRPPEIIALDDALKTLGKLSPRQAKLIELKFFAGLKSDEAAHVLEISTATVQRELRLAKAWLQRELSHA